MFQKHQICMCLEKKSEKRVKKMYWKFFEPYFWKLNKLNPWFKICRVNLSLGIGDIFTQKYRQKKCASRTRVGDISVAKCPQVGARRPFIIFCCGKNTFRSYFFVQCRYGLWANLKTMLNAWLKMKTSYLLQKYTWLSWNIVQYLWNQLGPTVNDMVNYKASWYYKCKVIITDCETKLSGSASPVGA